MTATATPGIFGKYILPIYLICVFLIICYLAWLEYAIVAISMGSDSRAFPLLLCHKESFLGTMMQCNKLEIKKEEKITINSEHRSNGYVRQECFFSTEHSIT